MQRYVMCKGYYGMGGNLAVLVSALRLAKELGRELIVDWQDSAYGLSNKDIYRVLFDEPSLKSPDRSKWGELRVWPPYWQGFIQETMPHSSDFPLSRTTSEMAEECSQEELENIDIIVVSRDDKYWHQAPYQQEMCELMKSLRPNQEILKQLNQFEKNHLGSNAIGVHFRHGNGERSVVPPDINWFFNAVDELSDISGEGPVLLCTDCSAVIDVFKNRYGNRLVFIDKDFPTPGVGAIYCAESDEDRMRSAVEAVVDIWALSRCAFFVGSKSFFSGAASNLSQGFDRSNSRWWVPKYRSHSPAKNHQSIETMPELEKAFLKQGIKTDGIFVESIDQNETKVLYLYEELGVVSRGFNDMNVKDIGEAIKLHRLY